MGSKEKDEENIDQTSGRSEDNPRAHMKEDTGSEKSPSQVEEQRTKEFGQVDKKEEK